jgi:hypothetical protein
MSEKTKNIIEIQIRVQIYDALKSDDWILD